MSMEVLGLGTALPAGQLSQAEAAELSSRLIGLSEEKENWLTELYQLTGIKRRHLSGLRAFGDLAAWERSEQGPTTQLRMEIYEKQVRPLAIEATRKALAAADTTPDDITHLVTVSCTGFVAPGFDIGLMTGLPLAPTVQRTHVGFMGCHGAINGLKVARAFAESEPTGRILLCAAELCSLHFQFGFDSSRSVANALFADGAAALVGAVPNPIRRSESWRLTASGSCLIHDTEDAMGWKIGDHGFEMNLSKRITHLIAEHLEPWLDTWLDGCDLAISDIATWAIHPGGPRVLESVMGPLGLNEAAVEESRRVLSDYGNMSSPTILFILDRLRRRGAPRPCVALAFGPGLAIEAALFT
jgi:predicted naringenin-chalcone synthase